MTNQDIRDAKEGDVLWDDVTRGLHVRCLNQKTFYLYYRTREGGQRRFKIGIFGEVTLTDARMRAKTLLDRVAVGEDPKGGWNEKKAEITVSELWARCWKEYWDCPRFQTSGWAKEAQRYFEDRIEPKFGTKKIGDVKAVEIREWHALRSDAPYAANRALEVLSKMFKLAEMYEIRPVNSNPCNLVAAHKERKRKRYATESEIKQIAALLERESQHKRNKRSIAFLYLLMFTGARPSAIAKAKWSQLKELDVAGVPYGVLTLHGKTTSETGEEETIILPPQAMRAIRELPRDSETITGLTRLPHRLWWKIRKETGSEDLWGRDWRRTFATVGLSGGVGISVIGELLNHQSTETTKIYAKLMNPAAVQASTQIADRMESLFNPPVRSSTHESRPQA